MPITGGGGNVVDWGLLTALQGTDDWKQKRLDRNAELRQADELRDIAEAEKIKQQQAGSQVFNIFNEVSKLKVLPPDTEKIRIKNEELINPIINGIKKYGGDVNMYLQSGGYNDLVKYSQDLQGSKEVSSALRRAKDYADFQNDVQSGKIIRPIYKEVNGSRQKLNPQDEISAFLDNKKDDFEYMGGFEPFVTDYRKSFSEVYGRDDRKPKTATKDDVYVMALHEAKKKGLSKDDAQYYSEIIADEYQKGIDSGNLTPYLYKSDNPLDDAIKLSTIEKNRASTNLSIVRANKIASGGDENPQDYWISQVLQGGDNAEFAVGDLIGANTGDGKIIDAEIVTNDVVDMPNPQEGEGKRAIGLTDNSTKVMVKYIDSNNQPITVYYDLNDANALGELSTLQASKTTSKTFPKRSQEYQSTDKNKNSQKQTLTTSSGIKFTVE